MNSAWFDHSSFFTESLMETDSPIYTAIAYEQRRQHQHIELIASENMVSKAVMEAQGSVLTNKYAEGYVGRRYYGGCNWVDEVERLAIDRAKSLFDCEYVNVQPHSGAQANGAVFLALLKPNDTILGMSLDGGGHLTHGAKPAMSGKWFNAVQYSVDADTQNIDYDQVERLAIEHKPKLIIAGGSAIPRVIDFARFRDIANKTGALLMVDMAHIAGLVAAKEHPSPIPFADVVTSTTHKTLRGPRGGLILTNDEAIYKKINSAVFPGLQGGPLMHVIAAKAVAFGEALEPSFKHYIQAVKANAAVLSETLVRRGIDIITGGTDTHLMLVDLRKQGLTGKAVEEALESIHITCNKNGVPNDPQKPTITSGIRLGSSAATSRGFGIEEFKQLGEIIADVIDLLIKQGDISDKDAEQFKIRTAFLCDQFPVYY